MAQRLPHGYTNATSASGNSITKTFVGLASGERYRSERACLHQLQMHPSVPTLLGSDDSALVIEMSIASGRHGQELIDEGHSRAVMRLLGAALSSLQTLHVHAVPQLSGDGSVLVHGDFGPQNSVFDFNRNTCVLIDWEFAHVGHPVEDLAWAEWIVRMHHPTHVEIVDELLAASKLKIPWHVRHQSMLVRSLELVRFCEAGSNEEGSQLWRSRLATTETWSIE